ncbi:MAG: alkaline phosphatase [Dysgonamonadaceae bacterium]|nr:alkaline phosphatase [Dysgonamonadaceae bacterium]MDD4728247.1 alkaline phosphatase [Dysgonamonadaceae bacterium]
MKRIILSITLFVFIAISAIGQDTIKVNSFTNDNPHQVLTLKKNSYFKKRAKNIIFLIGDGMGVAQVFSAITANRGVLNMTQMPFTGFSKTQSASSYTTDSAAGGTALSTGQRTYNGALAVDMDTLAIPTILEISKSKGYATGLVSSSSITHATPASFIAHQPKRSMQEEIAADFIGSDIDIFIGGGHKFFTERKDGRNLLDELRKENYLTFTSLDDAVNVKSGKLAILTAENHNETYPKRGEMLPDATEKAINILKNNKKGFFLMVEGSMIDWGGHANNTAYVVQEALDFDRAIAKALEFANSNKETLVIITADHETGGMAISDGDISKGEITGEFTRGGHTAIMVPVFAYGAGAEKFTGVYKNTDVFEKMMEAYGF